MPPTAPPPFKPKSKTTNYYLKKGYYTHEQLMTLFNETAASVDVAIKDIQPMTVKPSRWCISDIVVFAKQAHTPAEQLALQRTLVAKQDERAKKLKNDTTEQMLLEYYDVEQTLAKAYKTFGRWLDLLPDTFEKKGYIPSTKISEFVESVEKAKAQLQSDMETIK